jgi:hypothetical protein
MLQGTTITLQNDKGLIEADIVFSIGLAYALLCHNKRITGHSRLIRRALQTRATSPRTASNLLCLQKA